MNEIKTKHLFTMTLKAAAPQYVGRTGLGELRPVVVTEGVFEGEELKGTVREGGADWITIREDGAFAMDVRLVLETHDKALIGMSYRGFRYGPPDVMAQLDRNEDPDPSTYYFRSAVFFHTGAKQYDWMNRIVAVGSGRRVAAGPIYAVHQIL